ncbi:MAG: hypothetical protein WCG25_00785 [bacterium]
MITCGSIKNVHTAVARYPIRSAIQGMILDLNYKMFCKSFNDCISKLQYISFNFVLLQ